MKYVVVTGGVVSGLGKGVTASSIGVVLKACGLRVTSIKIDPYLNTDAGTMSPFEHGEVFVLDDGGEVDLDLGNYERFLDVTLTRDNNITTGKIYQSVIDKERRGDYLGKTVQVVPHITDEIQDWIERVASVPVDGTNLSADVCVIELGGVVGDIESSPFVEALRQFQFRVGQDSFCLVHVSLVPVLGATGEQKTKPTQHSVKDLRALGLVPNLLACRSAKPLMQSTKEKLMQFCHVSAEHVLNIYDVSNIWHVPLLLKDQKAHLAILKQLNLRYGNHLPLSGRFSWNFHPASSIITVFISFSSFSPVLHVLVVFWTCDFRCNCNRFQIASVHHPSFHVNPALEEWTARAELCDSLSVPVKIAMVGKYTGLSDSYLSVIKALVHASLACSKKLCLEWIAATDLEDSTRNEKPAVHAAAWDTLKNVDGILVPGGFGDRGVQGKILAAKFARENKVPYLGICLGMQIAVIEFCRTVLKLEDANSTEFYADTPHPCVIFMPEVSKTHMGGTMRLGSRKTYFTTSDCMTANLYKLQGHHGDGGEFYVEERHRHRYEVNPDMVEKLDAAGLHFFGKDETGKRMEILELLGHPYFVGVQFHPEFKSRPGKPAPLFLGFIRAASGSSPNVHGYNNGSFASHSNGHCMANGVASVSANGLL